MPTGNLAISSGHRRNGPVDFCRPGYDSEIAQHIREIRSQIMEAELQFPGFLRSLEPLESQSENALTDRMLRASSKAGVGPMAAVAGSVAQSVGELLCRSGCSEYLR